MFGRPLLVGAMGSGLRVDYLLVSGGNGGQSPIYLAADAGSGSGGLVIPGSIKLTHGSFAVTVGTGGADGGTGSGAPGLSGTHSAIAGVADTASLNGGSNGLGGGYNLAGVQTYGWGGQSIFTGGAPGGGVGSDGTAGHAGGAGAGAGGAATGATPGAGVISSISGAPVEYGRGGVTWTGLSTGFPGATAPSNPGNTGRGGYGGRGGFAANYSRGTAGQNGIVIIRYPSPAVGVTRATGGSVYALAGYTIHTFTSSGTFVVLA